MLDSLPEESKGTQIPIPCPDDKPGCCVYHCKISLTPEDIARNKVIQEIKQKWTL